jgi:hypothetical protein
VLLAVWLPGVLQFLKRNIQDGVHDSTQDACAAMDLALLKIKKGVWQALRGRCWGPVAVSVVEGVFRPEYEVAGLTAEK